MAFVYDNKEYRNLQEQVFKNMNDISFILQEEGVLNEFGIKVVGQEESAIDMPSVDDYKEDNPDWAYGDAYAIGTEAPYELYVLTRANGSHPNDYWFNIGEFPAPGPEGPEGPQGEQGVQGQTGPAGQDGVSPEFSIGTVSASTISAGQSATASVSMTGTYAQPVLNFAFEIPKGQDGSTLTSIAWGDITGSLANQTDLVSALQGKANASALLSYATQVYADNVANNAEYQAVSTIRNSANEFAGSMSFASDVVFNSYIYKGQSNYIDYPIELPSGSGTLALIEDIPSLTGYATEAWVSANFLSADTPIGGAAQWGSISGTLSDQTDLMSKVSEYALLSDIPSLSGYATETYVNNALSGYATESWVGSQGYITSAALSEYATISAVSSALSSYALSSSLSLYALSSVVDNLNYASVGALSSETVIPDITGLASEGYVNAQINNLSSVYAPIGSYATVSELSSAIADLSSVYASISALSVYATESYVTSAISALDYASVNALSADTVIPDITDLASEQYVVDAITDLSSVYQPIGSYVSQSDLSGYATESWVSSNFLSSGALPSMSLYAELSAGTYSNPQTFTGSNYFTKDICMSSNRGIYFSSNTAGPVPRIYATSSIMFMGLSNNLGMTLSSSGANSTYLTMHGGHIGVNGNPILTAYINNLGYTGGSIRVSQIASIGDLSTYASQADIDALSSVYAPSDYLPSGVSGYASEIWTFVVDDGQGGSSTVSKTILVG